MDMIGFVLILAMYIVLCEATDGETGILMRVYEDDIQVKNHWEAILYCALVYPGMSCSKMWWSHVIDVVHDVEENPEERSHTYRVKTELVTFTSRLEILTFTGNVTGPYTCQAKCGSDVYAVSCDVRDHPNANRSILCSERTFNARKKIAIAKPEVPQEDLAGNIQAPQSDAVVTLSVVGVIMGAIFITAVLRWLTKRMRVKKHYQQILQEISRQESQSPPESPQTPTTPTITATLLSPPVANPPPVIRNLVLPSMHEFFFGAVACLPDEVVYQSLPDGSQVVFIPRGKLPSYEAAVQSKKDDDSRDSGAPSPTSGSPSSDLPPSPAGASCTSGYGSSCSSETSLPPCYSIGQERSFSERSSPCSTENRPCTDHDVTEPLTICSEGNIPRANAAIRMPNRTVEYPPPEYTS